MKRSINFKYQLLSLLLITSVSLTQGGSDAQASRILLDPAGLTGSVPLRHRVIIPAILYFRVGSATFNSVDKVTFDLTQDSRFTIGTNTFEDGDENPLGDGNEVGATSTGGGSLVVDVRSNIGDVTISYTLDNTQGLSDGAGNFIDFEQIDTRSDDPTNLPAPVLSNTGGGIGSANSVVVAGHLFSGRVVNRQTIWKYVYKNETTPIAGTYEGRVTYIASAP